MLNDGEYSCSNEFETSYLHFVPSWSVRSHKFCDGAWPWLWKCQSGFRKFCQSRLSCNTSLGNCIGCHAKLHYMLVPKLHILRPKWTISLWQIAYFWPITSLEKGDPRYILHIFDIHLTKFSRSWCCQIKNLLVGSSNRFPEFTSQALNCKSDGASDENLHPHICSHAAGKKNMTCIYMLLLIDFSIT
jgi:hypothetical protein